MTALLARALLLSLGSVTLTLTPGCQRRSEQTAPVATRVAPAPAASHTAVALTSGSRPPDALPEDPVAGARSLALWREHLEEEERERKANYDRRHLREHRAVVALLRSAKRRLDTAPTAAAVEQLQATLGPELARIRSLVEKIDHWRVSSNVVREYEALVEALATTYPKARLAELDRGSAMPGDARADAEQRLKRIDEWLSYAEKAEDE